MTTRTTRTWGLALSAAAIAMSAMTPAGAAAARDVITGDGSDERLVGTPASDTIKGRGGSDRVLGRAGNDFLEGGTAPDLVRGGSGADSLLGGPGQDALYGEAGRDQLEGNGRHDLIYAGRGNDAVIFSFAGQDQGRDYANCGPGRDTVYVEPDSNDEIEPNCERVVVAQPH